MRKKIKSKISIYKDYNENESENKELVRVKKEVNPKLRNILFSIMVVICISLYGIALAPKTLQNDTFYTLKIGEWISQNGISNLTEDVFSWHELPYTYPHWLYDLCLFMIYNIGGQFAVYVSTIVLYAILGFCIYLNTNYKTEKKLLSFIFTMISMYLLKDYIAARAQAVTFCLFSFEVYFIEKFLNTHKKRYAIPLFIIPFLITNLHCAVFPFYFILFLPYIAEYICVWGVDKNLDYKFLRIALKIIMKFVPSDETYEKIQHKIDGIPEAIEKQKVKIENRRKSPYKILAQRNSFIKFLFIIFVVTAFLGFLNPAGTGAYTYTYKIYKGNTTKFISEHQPLTLIGYKAYLVGIAIFLMILLFTDTKIKLRDLFMVAGLVILSLMSKRQFSMVVIFCVPILAKVISDFIDKYDSKTYQKLQNFAASSACLIIIILGFGIYTTSKIRENISREYVDTGSYPEGAANWILANLDVNRIKIFNEYNYGSYLLFKGIPDFIDSRCDLYTPEFNGKDDIFSDALNSASIANSDFEFAYKKYGVTHLVIPANAKVLMFIRDNEDYKRLYEDYAFVVYERKEATKDDDYTIAKDEVDEKDSAENSNESNVSEN